MPAFTTLAAAELMGDLAGFGEAGGGAGPVQGGTLQPAMRPDGSRGPGLFKYLRELQGNKSHDRRDTIAAVFRGMVNRQNGEPSADRGDTRGRFFAGYGGESEPQKEDAP